LDGDFAQPPVQSHDHDLGPIDKEQPDIIRRKLCEGRCAYTGVQLWLENKALWADVLRGVDLGKIALEPHLFLCHAANPGFLKFYKRPYTPATAAFDPQIEFGFQRNVSSFEFLRDEGVRGLSRELKFQTK